MKKNLIIVGAIILVIIAIVLISISMKPATTIKIAQPEVRKPGELLPGEVRGVIGKGETMSPEDLANTAIVVPVKK